MSYELKDLRLFKAIVQAGNLSAGAAAMYMTAPSASYRLKNLEYAAGSPLFVRSARGMSLTPAGEALARHVDILLANLLAMQAEVSAYARNLKGSVRLLANSSSLNGFIIPSLARFLASNAHIDVDLQEQDSESIGGKILRGEADIGICAGKVDAPDLRCELYAIDRLVCAAAPDHALAQRPRIAFADVLSHGQVCMDRASSNFHFVQGQAQRLGKTVSVRVHAHDFSSVLYLVRAGVGVALVPASVAQPLVREGALVAVPLLDSWALRDLHLLTRQDAEPAGLARRFAEVLLHDPQVVAARTGKSWQ
ncbi:LysR family transcriptional regulator [Bordetella petrii]|uniref:LysR family transcriptional regulator n=1 Tax=Bordetella petrii TaxID=94624 RepID=UPI001E590551|nr:LysR family transcriptional regulator [Bordetella petrii]MCD0505093.1 LysR family transcriptional regulator [Bordetella petrii]